MDKVLIVDDETIASEYVFSLINWHENGYDVVAITNSAKQTMSILSSSLVDIVLMDVMMPDLTGIDLSFYIHENYPNIKMIAMSGYDDFDYVRQILLNGASDYILKHRLNSEVLIAALKKVSSELHETIFFPDSIKKDIEKTLKDDNPRNLSSLIIEYLYNCNEKDGALRAIESNLLLYLNEDSQNDVYVEWQYKKRLLTYDNLDNYIDENVKYFFRLKRLFSDSDLYSSVVKKVIKFIMNMYAMNLTLEDAANIAGVNTTYLSRLFHKEVGRTFVEELTYIRIFYAKKMIRENHNLKKVALECGFKSYSYFFKVFHKMTSFTPTEYFQLWQEVKILHQQ